ncbi:hypothetical protein [Bradyrhizobium sp. NAS96.2]|uniref:hypothetical protein n=1 Tax=Bradyrhizobium sp. NAS96.2 TaxID=1680160 RepID=UPI0032DEEB89
MAAKLADLLGLRQGREGGSDRGIANPKQRPGARRFQHHLVAAPAQIGEARQRDGITVRQLCGLRPVLGDLRLDDHEVLLVARRGEAVFEKPLPRQSLHQGMNLPREDALAGKGGERQAGGEMSRTVDRRRAEMSQIDRVAADGRGDASVRLHMKGKTTVQSGGDDWCDLLGRPFPENAHGGQPSGVWKKRSEFAFRSRAVQ